jgi:hypothetical protein
LNRDNLLYIILAVIAVSLVGVTIGLQLLIISGQDAAQVESSASPELAAAQTRSAAPTDTPLIIITRITADVATEMPPTLPAESPPSATSLPTIVPPTVEVPTIAPPPVEPSPTLLVPTPTPASFTSLAQIVSPTDSASAGTGSASERVPLATRTDANDAPNGEETNAIAVPTVLPEAAATVTVRPTATPSSDYVFGYLVERPGCQMMTEIAATLIEQNYGLVIATQAYTDEMDLYQSLAQQGDALPYVHLTVCHLFPLDSEYLLQFGNSLRTMGSAYAQVDSQRWHVLSHSGLAQLRREQPCMYALLGRLDLVDLEFPLQDARAWMAQNRAAVETMVSCEDL